MNKDVLDALEKAIDAGYWDEEGREFVYAVVPGLISEYRHAKKGRDELLDALDDVLYQSCWRSEKDEGVYDSLGLSSYAEGLRQLAKHGRVKIVEEHGRRVIAHALSDPVQE